jgi:hypothetical protein
MKPERFSMSAAADTNTNLPSTETIYVKLLDEGMDVWRPVQAVRVSGQAYEIIAQHVDETETWEFLPGSKVWVELVKGADGSFPAAVQACSETALQAR